MWSNVRDIAALLECYETAPQRTAMVGLMAILADEDAVPGFRCEITDLNALLAFVIGENPCPTKTLAFVNECRAALGLRLHTWDEFMELEERAKAGA
ncbi:hypothetical protein [Rhodococcus opacus]|uniref:Uncharacterized protein n=1 Tax=Rhodococcus opacus (strain B4) TaxID=632772 RepID=C1AWA9_RHOOB|nr:hypothetical protein [Rhodococcus opacus]BAH53682.1 hypothetical protein ROP_54350 [Rhodococcus opacus B4]